MNVSVTKIEEIIADIDMVAKVAAMFPPAAVPAIAADKILQLIQSSIAAHVAITGKPWDAALLAPVKLA